MKSFKLILVLVLLATSLLAEKTMTIEDLQAIGLEKLSLELGNFDLNLDEIDQSALKEYYRQYDTDGSNSFDFKEFTVIYQDDEKPFTEETILKHFNEADSDKNGVVDYDELVVFSLSQIPLFAETQDIDIEEGKQQNDESDKNVDL